MEFAHGETGAGVGPLWPDAVVRGAGRCHRPESGSTKTTGNATHRTGRTAEELKKKRRTPRNRPEDFVCAIMLILQEIKISDSGIKSARQTAGNLILYTEMGHSVFHPVVRHNRVYRFGNRWVAA